MSQEAVRNLERAVELAPRLAEAQYNLGRAYHKAGQLEQAIAAYQRATVLRPTMAQGHYNLGTALGCSAGSRRQRRRFGRR